MAFLISSFLKIQFLGIIETPVSKKFAIQGLIWTGTSSSFFWPRLALLVSLAYGS